MKKTMIICSLFLAAATTQAADKKTATTPAATTEAAATTAATPAQACTLLVEAAKTENFATVQALSTMPGHGMHKGEGKFKKMHADYLTKIKGITCGAEHVADGHAVVEAESEGKKRLVPFVNENGTWKFNAQAYKAFYDDGKGAHGKKM